MGLGMRAGWDGTRTVFAQAIDGAMRAASVVPLAWRRRAGSAELVPALIHMHSHFSDGARSVGGLAWSARSLNCRIVVITDHYEDIPLSRADRARKSLAGLVLNPWKQVGFAGLLAACYRATRSTGVLVVPSVEIDLGERFDPYADPYGWVGGWPKVHLLGIGAWTPGVYEEVSRRIIGAAARVAQSLDACEVLDEADPTLLGRLGPGDSVRELRAGSVLPRPVDEGVPLDALFRANRENAKCLSLSAGQRIAAQVMGECDLAVIGAHPWEKDVRDPFHQWGVYRRGLTGLHGVEAFGRGSQEERDEGALHALGLHVAQPETPASLDWCVTAGPDYHCTPWMPAKTTWVHPPASLDAAGSSPTAHRRACWELAQILRQAERPVVAGVGLPRSRETCARWCARIGRVELDLSRPSLRGEGVTYHSAERPLGASTAPPPGTPHIARVPGRLCLSRGR